MANSPVWDARFQFEQYVYDYMKKSGRTEAAEVFRREANLAIDPQVPPEIDVPDGFLHEWWLTFYDHYNAWDTKDHQPRQGYSAKDINTTNIGRQTDPALSKQHELNEQRIRELNINSDFGLTIAHASTPSTSTHWSSTETDKTSQAKTSAPPGNLGDRATQTSNRSQVPQIGKTASSKKGRTKKGSVPLVDGNNDKPGSDNARSEASLEGPRDVHGTTTPSLSHVKCKKASKLDSCGKKDHVELCSSAKGKEDEAGDSSCKDGDVKLSSSSSKETIDGEGGASKNLKECHHSKDDMKDAISLGRHSCQAHVSNGFYIICLFIHISWELGILSGLCFFHAVCSSTEFTEAGLVNGHAL